MSFEILVELFAFLSYGINAARSDKHCYELLSAAFCMVQARKRLDRIPMALPDPVCELAQSVDLFANHVSCGHFFFFSHLLYAARAPPSD